MFKSYSAIIVLKKMYYCIQQTQRYAAIEANGFGKYDLVHQV